ncbi:alpha/beta hydrolase [Nocardioides salsibiostraticola]
MRRRTLLMLPAIGAAGLALAACGEDAPVREPTGPGEGRLTYGQDPSQFGDLYLPEGEPRGVVVVIHGGFWKSGFDLSLGAPLATSLAAEGWAAWNLEYRRVGTGSGAGGGTPQTFDDIAAGIDKLADTGLDLSTVVTLGHSAGGHLAVWAAARDRYDWPGGVPVTAAISQAGVLDLVGGSQAGLGGGAVEAFLGRTPTAADAAYDPLQQLPLDVPVWCVHGTDDTIVPISQSQTYVAAATEAGSAAELVEVDGDHFVLIDATSPAWTRTLEILDDLG